MARDRISKSFSIDFGHDNPEWEQIRKAAELKNQLEDRGKQWVDRLNDDLHAAQAKRKQPVEDGYTYEVTTEGSRDRLYVWPYSARAIAHEAVNQSMLKLVPIGDIKSRKGPDHKVPKELAERSNAAQGRTTKKAKRAAAKARREAKKQGEQ